LGPSLRVTNTPGVLMNYDPASRSARMAALTQRVVAAPIRLPGLPSVLCGAAGVVLLSVLLVPPQLVRADQSYAEDHPVLAYYYNWRGPETFAGTIEQPIVDYASPDRVRAHVRQAQSAGIDGFIVNRATDMREVLRASDGTDFRVTLQVDTPAALQDVDAF